MARHLLVQLHENQIQDRILAEYREPNNDFISDLGVSDNL